MRPARKRPDRDRELDRALKDYLRYMVDFDARRVRRRPRDQDELPTEPPLALSHSTWPEGLIAAEPDAGDESA